MTERAEAPPAQDWPTERIKQAIYEKGLSQAALARQAGLAESAVRNAMGNPHNPRAEAAVAALLGVSAQHIWPSRYFADGRRRAAIRIPRNNIGSSAPAKRQISVVP